ncbi:hypothetical protein AOQ84DRAFT_373151 [Glonium stellatum]|uniref:Fungal N-terminal domain-containing protein n=1 Tax=Glonium stellatum TaxID=574774 RepID=A0A8E2F891_9PEZI|nr:hypothetical protein AOQ84DRAFT_373151 [Glonium stellatum]
MAEAAIGLVLGVLSVMIEAIKAYERNYDKITTLRAVSREVGRLLKKFERQKQFFENECHLLLRLVLKNDNQKARKMIENSAHHLWTEHGLDSQVEEPLSNNYGTCTGIVQDTKVALSELGEVLKSFEKVVNRQRSKASYIQQGESIRDTIHRIRQSVKVAFEKSWYEKKLEALRDHNADLRLLRSQIFDFHHQLCFTKNFTSRSLPSTYYVVQQASQSLYNDLTGSWCCSDTAYARHYASLYPDAKGEETVHLDLAISYQNGDSMTN